MNVRDITCKSACRPLKRRYPYPWDLNPYRGCAHGCQYCFALYTHQYLESDRFFDEIHVKTNILDVLERQLSRADWPREVVAIGSVTDCYQPLESRYRLMPDILRLFIRYRTPCIISTKSDLILRDFDLIDELSRLTYVNVAATITTADERVRARLEPHAATAAKRFAMLSDFSKTRASTAVHIMPLIPYLTDGRDNLEALYHGARQAQVSYVLPGLLHLRGRTRDVFFDFLRRDFPHLYAPLSALYGKNNSLPAYKTQMYRTVNETKEKYGISGDYMSDMKKLLAPTHEQLSFF